MAMVIGKEWQGFEREIVAGECLTLEQKYDILDALYAEAVTLCAFPLKDPLEGLDVDLRIARVVAGVQRTA